MPPVIAKVRGILAAVDETHAEIEPEGGSGIVLSVLLPAYLADALRPRAGEPVTLHTITYLEGVGQGTSFIPRLIGFERPADRAFFELLTTVKGLGNRKTLRALTRPPHSVALAIRAGDIESLQTLPEIGKRTAETIVHELKRKVEPMLIALAGDPDSGWGEAGGTPDAARGGLAVTEVEWAHPLGPAATEAVSALVTLGESRKEASRLVAAAIKECGEAALPDEILAAAFGKRGT